MVSWTFTTFDHESDTNGGSDQAIWCKFVVLSVVEAGGYLVKELGGYLSQQKGDTYLTDREVVYKRAVNMFRNMVTPIDAYMSQLLKFRELIST